MTRYKEARRAAKKALLAGLFGFFCPLVVGQMPSHGPARTVVNVTDLTGAPIPHALVVAVRTLKTDAVSGETDDSGNLSLGLLAGSYDLSVRSPGFSPLSKRILVHGSKHQVISFALPVGSCPPGGCSTVTTENTPSFELSRTPVQSMIDEK
jgi:Carboxypeptidase regulatory-like domain